ncbi:DMT family transporter [Clostridium algoriphilum]|uniref:DMT family transporter n=1 Tax=Clostridium algoriphilum TaxID=198347 RepID=UPI001CF3BF84|nr:DMT family transporter [Clostridium algoriphilum]MCB2293668.1 DMT family transporter [Clostridium algoriphilum]
MSNSNNSKVGCILGIGSGLAWGLDAVIIGIILAASLFSQNDNIIFLAPFVAAFLKDGLSAIYMSIINISRGNFKSVLKGFKTKGGLFIAIGALFGGPLGMTCYMFSMRYIGPAYTANISAVYPAIGAVLAFILLKEKIEKSTWMGIGLSVLGVFVLGYFGGGTVNKGTFIIGVLFALGAVVGWASESVICAYGMKDDIGPIEALNIRYIISAIVYGAIIVPILKGHFLTGEVLASNTIWLLVLSALVATTSFIFYYKTIYLIGAAKGTALNITYALWTIVFHTLIFHTPITSELIVGSVIITLGTVLVIVKPSQIFNFKRNIQNF